MDTPSPAPTHTDHMSQHTYQTTSEGSDHSLLGHSHQCLCPNDHTIITDTSQPPPIIDHHCHTPITNNKHHLNVINQLSHGPPCTGGHPHHPQVYQQDTMQSHHVRASIHASPKSNNSRNSNNIIQSKSSNPNGVGGCGGNQTIITQCTCHLMQQTTITTTTTTPINCNEQSIINNGPPEIHEANIVQNRKLNDADDSIEVSPLPPALPPRPPPRQRICGDLNIGLHGSGGSMLGGTGRGLRDGGSGSHHHHNGIKKYVFWCCACGGLSTIIGALFLAVYFMLRSYTSTLTYFETIPTFVPATMLMLTGLCVMSLARRRNRFSYLIKVSGICCLVCALTCVLVTITTTVIHMNRLQTLRECVYTQKTRTCTCYSVLLEAHAETDEGTRFVFDSTPDCEVIHGALYSCLRAMFGLSVSGILVCIFSCMLVYQLLSHERKKMYWEQLELRCRSLYQHQSNSGVNSGSVRGPPVSLSTGSGFCSCCEECRYTPIPANPHLYPWDTHALDRFWTPGRIGNFYSPNPGEEIGPTTNTNIPGLNSTGNNVVDGGSMRVRNNNTGWNWRRLPWNRSGCPDSTRASGNFNYPTTISSPDSQYGFSSVPGLASGPVSSSIPGSGVESITATTGSGGYTVLADRPPPGAYLWGPPPPYSNPDSPARRGMSSPARYHHPHHHLHHPHSHLNHCQLNEDNPVQAQNPQIECQHRPRSRPTLSNISTKDNYENTTESEAHQISTESAENTDNSSSDRISNTLPVRKTKKRIDISSVKSVTNNQNFRTNIQNIFTTQTCSQNFDESSEQSHTEEHNYQEPNIKNDQPNSPDTTVPKCRFLPRLQGVENPAFQTQENTSPQKQEPTESEVYFADVSSCCNISVRNDGQDSSLYDEALDTKQRVMTTSSCTHKNDKDNNKINQNFHSENVPNGQTEDEDYLAHRMGKRQMSTRSRLPFPLPNGDDHCKELNSEACLQLLPKDISQNSLSSSNVQTPLTDTTDDALTPVSQSFSNSECCINYYAENNQNVDMKTHQRHRTFSTESVDDQFLAPDAQYEVIQQTSNNPNYLRHSNGNASNLTTTISGLNNFGNQSFGSQNFSNNQNTFPVNTQSNTNFSSNNLNFMQNNSPKNVPPKPIKLCSSPRKNIGSNISTLIQNLGGNPVGLLYGEVNSGEEEEEIQTQGNHSDATMDSGWQSGSDRPEGNRGDSSEETAPRSVNV